MWLPVILSAIIQIQISIQFSSIQVYLYGVKLELLAVGSLYCSVKNPTSDHLLRASAVKYDLLIICLNNNFFLLFSS